MGVSERKYVMTKIASGDYLLPSNDAQTIWRISTYEDGPSYGLMDVDKDFSAWRIYKWTGDPTTIDVEDWYRWYLWEESFPTRRAAVDRALKDA